MTPQQMLDIDLIAIQLARCKTGLSAFEILANVPNDLLPGLCVEMSQRQSISPVVKLKVFQVTGFDAVMNAVGLPHAVALFDQHVLPFNIARFGQLQKENAHV